MPEEVTIRPLAEVEKEAILYAVRASRNVTEAAQKLGIGKTTIYRKMREYLKGNHCAENAPKEI